MGEYADLLWALLGGGGAGNFGIVQRWSPETMATEKSQDDGMRAPDTPHFATALARGRDAARDRGRISSHAG